MHIIDTKLKDVYILEPRVFGDSRGWFMESWSQKTMEEAGLYYNFVQDNHSYSEKKGTLRGIHYQTGGYSQAKLVRCSKGAVLDFVVDLRRGSPTYLQWLSEEISEANRRQLLIPRGFGHAFLTLSNDVEFMYKADQYYEPKADRAIRWNDPELGINWTTDKIILSEKDRNASLLNESDIDFGFEG